MRLLFLISILGLAQQLSAQVATVPHYKVGDTVCGGILFYVVNDNRARVQRGLVCSMMDLGNADHPWYNGHYDTTKATVDSLFDIWNANTVINKEGRSGNYAAWLANSYYVPITVQACFLDSTWYLPSRVELNTLYAALRAMEKGGFADEGYWSSVEGGGPAAFDSAANNIPRNAGIVDFYNGNTLLVDKANNYRVRAVRKVTVPYVNPNLAKARSKKRR